MELNPVTRQKVNAILRKHHAPAQKVKDRISWHWWNGFRVAEPKPGRVEVYHETEFFNSASIAERDEKLQLYCETLERYGICSYVVHGNALVVAGVKIPPNKQNQAELLQRGLWE